MFESHWLRSQPRWQYVDDLGCGEIQIHQESARFDIPAHGKFHLSAYHTVQVLARARVPGNDAEFHSACVPPKQRRAHLQTLLSRQIAGLLSKRQVAEDDCQ